MVGVLIVGDDVGRGAQDGGCVIHHADLGPPLVVALLGAREPGLGMLGALPGSRERGLGRSASGRITIPLPSAEITNRAPTLAPGGLSCVVEVLEVGRGDLGEFLDLAFGEMLPGVSVLPCKLTI